MKKIGLMTIFNSRNYGACLQCLATVLFLKEHGYDPELINYTDQFDRQDLKWFSKEGGKVSGYAKSFISNVFFGKMNNYKKINASLLKYCRLSPLCRNVEDIDKLTYDVMISGSDQIWNSKITGIDEAFLLTHGHARKRISLASSIGSHSISNEDREIFRKALLRFDAISVREQFARQEISTLTDKPVEVILDPSLWLSGKYWRDNIGLESPYNTRKKPYIVTYFVGSNKNEYARIVQNYAKKFNMPVYDILFSNFRRSYANKYLAGLTVNDFVAVIDNADLVITDSFHGTAFSCNLNTNFVSVVNRENPVRVKELLDSLGLSERIHLDPEKYAPVDFIHSNKILQEMREKSVKWIVDALQ